MLLFPALSDEADYAFWLRQRPLAAYYVPSGGLTHQGELAVGSQIHLTIGVGHVRGAHVALARSLEGGHHFGPQSGFARRLA